MPKPVKEFPRKAMSSFYEQYFDGQVWEFDKKDQGTNPKSFRTALVATAAKFGFKGKSQVVDGKLYFQTTPRKKDK